MGLSSEAANVMLLAVKPNLNSHQKLPELKQYQFEVLQPSLSHEDGTKPREMLSVTGYAFTPSEDDGV